MLFWVYCVLYFLWNDFIVLMYLFWKLLVLIFSWLLVFGFLNLYSLLKGKLIFVLFKMWNRIMLWLLCLSWCKVFRIGLGLINKLLNIIMRFWCCNMVVICFKFFVMFVVLEGCNLVSSEMRLLSWVCLEWGGRLLWMWLLNVIRLIGFCCLIMR